jgi:hypothetical protein
VPLPAFARASSLGELDPQSGDESDCPRCAGPVTTFRFNLGGLVDLPVRRVSGAAAREGRRLKAGDPVPHQRPHRRVSCLTPAPDALASGVSGCPIDGDRG